MDDEEIRQWSRQRDQAFATNNPALAQKLQAQIDQKRAALRQAWSDKRKAESDIKRHKREEAERCARDPQCAETRAKEEQNGNEANTNAPSDDDSLPTTASACQPNTMRCQTPQCMKDAYILESECKYMDKLDQQRQAAVQSGDHAALVTLRSAMEDLSFWIARDTALVAEDQCGNPQCAQTIRRTKLDHDQADLVKETAARQVIQAKVSGEYSPQRSRSGGIVQCCEQLLQVER